MGKVCAIFHYEYKMQLQRPATWGVFLAATAIALLDNFPCAKNLARLEFLNQPAYFICRTMSLDALILVFGLVFLLSNRFLIDPKTGMKAVIMASPIRKGQYVTGKLLAAFAYTLTVLCVFLVLNMAVYCAAAPFKTGAAECVWLILKTLLISGMPVSLFVSFCAAILPAVMDIRMFYLLIAAFFGWNASYVGTAGAMPFYLVTSGDLSRLIWVHPKWPQIDMGSVRANFLFLVGCGLTSLFVLLVKRGFWRTE